MKKILIIEDDQHLSSVLVYLLEKEGFSVDHAENGAQASTLYKQNIYCLIITDIIMPGKDGFEIIMDLKTFQPETKILAISGGGLSDPEEYLRTGKTLGATATLQKPFEKSDLLKAVHNLME